MGTEMNGGGSCGSRSQLRPPHTGIGGMPDATESNWHEKYAIGHN